MSDMESVSFGEPRANAFGFSEIALSLGYKTINACCQKSGTVKHNLPFSF